MKAIRIVIALCLALGAPIDWVHADTTKTPKSVHQGDLISPAPVAQVRDQPPPSGYAGTLTSRSAPAFGSEKAPLFVETIKSRDEQIQDDEERKSLHFTDLLMVIFNGLLALFTFALAIETWRLRKLANQQAADMKASIDLARQSSDAALALERPIFILENGNNPVLSPTVTLKFGNHGRTPAVIVANCLVLKIDMKLPENPRYPIASCVIASESRIVDPKNSYEIVRQTILNEASEQALRCDQGILWAYGYLDYIDFLRQRRRIGFCFAFERIANPTYPELASGGGRWVIEGPVAYNYEIGIAEQSVHANPTGGDSSWALPRLLCRLAGWRLPKRPT